MQQSTVDKAKLFFGGTSILLGLVIDSYFKKEVALAQQQNKLVAQSQYQPQKDFYDKLIKKTPQGVKIAVSMIQTMPENIKKQTLLIRRRQQPLRKNDLPVSFENIQGGAFESNRYSNEIIFNLDNVTVLPQVLLIRQKQLKKFGYMRPVAKQVQLTLKPLQSICFVGLMSYDIQMNKFLFDIHTIGPSLQCIIEMYQIKHIFYWLARLFPLTLIVYGGYHMWRPVKKLGKKLIHFLSNGKYFNTLKQQEHYKKVLIKTNPNNLYTCVVCEANPTEIIYRCGHLCICSSCNEKKIAQNNRLQCPVCHQESTDFEKIYFP